MHTGNEYLTPGLLEVAVSQGERIVQGAMVGVNAFGYAVTAATDSMKIIGVADNDVDTTLETEAGMAFVKVKRGAFLVKNKDLKQADLFRCCYISDAQTVTKEASGSITAGTAIALESGYVVVEIGGSGNGN